MDNKTDKTKYAVENEPGMDCMVCGGKVRRLEKEEIENLRLLIPNTGVCTACNEMHIIHRLSETSVFAMPFGGKLPV